MMILQQSIRNSPFFILALVLLAVGFASVLFNLLRTARQGHKRNGSNGENRVVGKLYVLALIVVLAGVIFFINWLGKMKHE